jgi:hypothetical protein
MRSHDVSRTHRVVALLAMLLPTLLTTGCEVGVAGYPDGYYDDYGYPPDEYIATTSPVYYGGYPSYYYGGRWFYRDGGHWRHFEHEPAPLYHSRIAAPPARRNYEPAFRSHGSFSAHGGGHFGGGHSGGGHR